MENKEILAGNKLIAEFLNRKLLCPTRGYLKKVLVNKLDNMSFDMKYYININASIGKSGEYPFIMDVEDVEEFLEIRNKIKRLSYKLKNQLKN